MTDDALEELDDIVATLDYPMFVVTTTDGHEHSGCLVGFASQCSIDPVRMFVCLSKANHTFDVAERSQTLIIHVLRDDQHELARLFGELTGDDVDKFEACSWRVGPDGVRVLEGCDWIAGRVLDRVDVGDHVGHVLEVIAAGHNHPGGQQLGFQAVKKLDPGHDA